MHTGHLVLKVERGDRRMVRDLLAQHLDPLVLRIDLHVQLLAAVWRGGEGGEGGQS
jgi:hypothetical protein